MSKTERREYMVGIMAAALLAAVLVFTALANRGAAQAGAGEDAFILTAAFNRADGIHVGSPVRVAGMAVGDVAKAALDAEQRAVLTFRFTSALDLPEDTAAVIETDGLFGTKYIELRPGGTDELLKSGGRISYTQDSVIIEDLVELVVQRAKAAAAEKPSGANPPSSEPTP